MPRRGVWVFDEAKWQQNLKKASKKKATKKQIKKVKLPPNFQYANSDIKVSAKEKILIPLDSDKIREKAESDCKKVINKIDLLKQEVDQFETIDKPCYDSWINSHFQEIFFKTRTKIAEVEEKRELISHVYDLAYVKGISFPESYHLIIQERELEKKRIEEWEKRNNETESDEKTENFSEDDFMDEDESEDEDNVFREEFNEFFKRFRERYQQDFGKKNSEVEKEENSSFKEKYHELVKKLHPDKNKNQSKQERELWNELQEAYKSKDEGKLDYILQNFEAKTGKKIFFSSIFDLKKTKKTLEKSLRSIQSQIRKFKKEPSWNFFKATLTEKNKIKKEIETEVKQTNRELDKENEQFSKLIEAWKSVKIKPNKIMKKEAFPKEDFFEFYTKF